MHFRYNIENLPYFMKILYNKKGKIVQILFTHGKGKIPK